MKTATINVRVTETTIQQLDDIVNRTMLDRSDHIRLAVSEYISRHNSSAPIAHLSMTPETAAELPDQSPSGPTWVE